MGVRLCLLLMVFGVAPGSAFAACAGPGFDDFDFWLGAWRDVASPEGAHYVVRRDAGGCAVEEILYADAGAARIIGMGLSGYDPARHVWRQFWVDRDGAVTLYEGGRQVDGTVVLLTEPKPGGVVWRYVYRNISAAGVDAEYAMGRVAGTEWKVMWRTHYERPH